MPFNFAECVQFSLDLTCCLTLLIYSLKLYVCAIDSIKLITVEMQTICRFYVILRSMVKYFLKGGINGRAFEAVINSTWSDFKHLAQ